MSYTISGQLHGTDYSDPYTVTRSSGPYSYEMTPSGGGRASFKVEWYQPHFPDLPKGTKEGWATLEDKSKIASGVTASGTFTVPKTLNGPNSSVDSTEIRLTFAREFLSEKVDYKLVYNPV
jgi:hypothetical protein